MILSKNLLFLPVFLMVCAGVLLAAPDSAPPAGPPEIPGLDGGIPLPDFGGDLPMPGDPPTPGKAEVSQPSSAAATAEVQAAPTESAAPASSTSTAQAAPTTPPAVPPTATASATPTATPRRSVPTPVRRVPPTATATLIAASMTGTPVARDYFPAVSGAKREYQFFRLPGQTTGRKNRVVECLQTQAFPNGTVRSTFKTTVFAGGSYKDEIVTDTYSAYANIVYHTSHDGQALKDRYLIKMPPPGGTERWSHTEADGTVVNFKANFTPLKTEDRIYPDCILVLEKVMKGTNEMALRNFYYARGIGLVRLEVFDKGLNVDRSDSIDIVETAPQP